MMVCLGNFVLWMQVHKASEIREIYENVQHLLKVTPNQKLVLCLAEPFFTLINKTTCFILISLLCCLLAKHSKRTLEQVL